MSTLFSVLTVFTAFVLSSGYITNTIITSDSNRDYYYAHNIFVYIDDDTMCGNQMNFKIDTFQSGQYDIFEKKICSKWRDVISTKSTSFNYDIFLDFNIAFWVNSLDPFISKWEQTYHDKMEYFGIEWYYNLNDIDLEIKSRDYKNNKFYSVLIHSPESNINYEFISYRKPSDKYYKNMKWINSNIIRATFKGQNNPFPWNRNDKISIVPLRISRATTDIDKIIDDFNINDMEANILYISNGIIIDDLGGDNIETKTIIFTLFDTKIELQFYERPSFYTSGDLTLKEYEELLIETHDNHNEVITSSFCYDDNYNDKQLHLFGIINTGQQHHEKYIFGTLTGLMCGMIMCGIYYFYKKWKKQRLIRNINMLNNTDKTPLIIKK